MIRASIGSAVSRFGKGSPERSTARRLPSPRRVLRVLTLTRLSALIGLLGLVLTVGGTAYIAWDERRVLIAEAHDHAAQSASYLADHAERLFEVADVVLHAVETSTADMDSTSIMESTELGLTLRHLDEMIPYVQAVFIADQTGKVVATSLNTSPTNYSVADRSVFREAQRGDTNLLVGEIIRGRASGQNTFLVARRRSDARGDFAGLFGAAMSLDYFTTYWARLDTRNDEQLALVRTTDGKVLVRYPGEDDAVGGREIESLMGALADGKPNGTFEPDQHVSGVYRRLGSLPLVMAVTYRDAVITSHWYASLAMLLPLAALAFSVLFAMVALAVRLGRQEARTRAELRSYNQRLERRVAERTADLLESNREIQRFAYIVSHDLRAPLVNIMGFTSELKELRDAVLDGPRLPPDAMGRVRADFEEAFGFIQSSIDKMDRLIKAILGLSRQGQRVFRPEVLDMTVLMRSVVDGVAHRAQEIGARIEVGPLPAVVADRLAVEQVFANLVDNAVKYLKPAEPGLITIEGTATASGATFTLSDNGRGIHPDDHERVFELFRRAGKQEVPGEGIGLANVRSLVRRLQGTITLDSAPGRGSVFSVTLPRVPAGANSDE